MQGTRRQFLTRLLLLLAAGLVIGWLYDAALAGLLLAALAALAYFTWQLFRFENALLGRALQDPGFGDSIWSQMLARVNYLQQRGRKHKRRYRRLLTEVRDSTNAMPDAGIVLNSDFEILMCNPAAEELVGIRWRQDRGQRVDNILRHPGFVRYLHSANAGDAAVDIPSPLKEGNWLSCRLVPYGGDQQLLLIRDITERIRLNTMRREFIANASHELRSPLTVISGYLDSLASDPDLSPHWSKPVLQMRTQANRMNKIVAELLELSRVESAGTSVDDESVDVPGLLTGARKAYIDQPGIAEIRVETPSRARLRASGTDIESLISNLLSNAIRHTPASGTITLSWTSDDQSAVLSVSDTGEGVDEEHIPRLTERFFRVDAGRSRDDGGVGLGLAIVKHILNRHDAELQITSVPGEGSTFSCHFPARRIETTAPTPIERKRQSGAS
ncbi:MAG: phosphate regulon sensor histidine kinase PhoR [Woeseia sp.]